jgi:hypothetical protein
MVAVKVAMVPQGSEKELLNAINRVEKDFRAAFPSVIWLFFEPDHSDE